ncbi:hypothetical protein [Bartonella sp. B1098]|uniref:hypothetical protein n=1 Tax=Bartonella sp. B1098 TaxID=2911421 RepID=UPI0020C51EE3|nr:hypothetical protein [Bartonella sp. B1098]
MTNTNSIPFIHGTRRNIFISYDNYKNFQQSDLLNSVSPQQDWVATRDKANFIAKVSITTQSDSLDKLF